MGENGQVTFPVGLSVMIQKTIIQLRRFYQVSCLFFMTMLYSYSDCPVQSIQKKFASLLMDVVFLVFFLLKLFLASYYKQLSADIKRTIVRLNKFFSREIPKTRAKKKVFVLSLYIFIFVENWI